MAFMTDAQLKAHADGCLSLIERKSTLLLSTLSPDTFPDISYAPYVRDEAGSFYIYISRLAAHTHNLLAHAKCSVLFVQDEADSRNLFARERVTFRCAVTEVAAGSDQSQKILDRFEQQHGQTVAMLRTLPDFHLFALKPVSGTYVVGFGKAFEVNPDEFGLIHLDENRVKGR